MTRQPSFRNSRFTRRSRALFAANFRFQNARLPAGMLQCLGQPCQKQPSTKIASRFRLKRKSGLRLGQFADAHAVPISTISSKQIQDWLINRGVAGRTQNNYRRLISTLFKFAIRRGYLPKDHDELSGVEKIKDSGGEIEVFTPGELRKLFAACETPVKERGKWRHPRRHDSLSGRCRFLRIARGGNPAARLVGNPSCRRGAIH